MSITGALVLFATLFFLVLFLLPNGLFGARARRG